MFFLLITFLSNNNNNFFFFLVVASTLFLLILSVNNFVIVICLFYSIIIFTFLLLLYSGLQLLSFMFFIVYGGGLMVLYFIVIQFNSIIYYNNTFSDRLNKWSITLLFVYIISILGSINNYYIFNKVITNIDNITGTYYTALDLITELTSFNYSLVLIGLLLTMVIYIVISLFKTSFNSKL